MPTTLSLSHSRAQAANDNGAGSRAQPAVALLSLAELLAEVCVARLAAANDNQAPISNTLEGTL